MLAKEGTYVFKFAQQRPAPHIVQIARRQYVSVEHEGKVLQVHASGDEIAVPELYLHRVQHAALDSMLNILVNGFDYGEHSTPFGIYSVDANHTGQNRLVKSYDGGAAIVFKSTGFVVNISQISSNKKLRDHPYPWLTGVIPGTILFRRMRSEMREFIHHLDNIQYHYVSIEQQLFDAWLHAPFQGTAGKASIKRAKAWREALNSGDTMTISPASLDTSLAAEACTDVQRPAVPSGPARSQRLAVAHPTSDRVRSRSRSPKAPASGVSAQFHRIALHRVSFMTLSI